MANETFNLTTEPWIKVTERKTNATKMVSLIDLFEHAQDYRQLAGDMHTQDLAVLRVLLAILTTVYSRYDADGQPYPWLAADPVEQATLEVDRGTYEDAVLATWKQLFEAGRFSTIVIQYLQKFANRFDLFGDHPFYQVTTADYDALVAEKKRVALGKGTVAIKQFNRRVSESNNTPAIFAPKADTAKNQLTLDELARWLITYQNYAGTTDKTKIETGETFSSSPGWLYKLDAVYADGQTLFETLMLNLVLINEDGEYTPQHPVWEVADLRDYVDDRSDQTNPNNIAELYTSWARILHLEWDDVQQPTIFSAGLPMFDGENAYIEPMTTWRRDKKHEIDTPATRSSYTLSKAMWRNFGSYVRLTPDTSATKQQQEPGIVWWLNQLKDRQALADNQSLSLASVTFVSGGAPANLPIAEYHDDIQIMAGVLFDRHQDEDDYWPVYIENVIQQTQKIGTDFYSFAMNVGRVRGMKLEAKPFANKLSDQFYSRLNDPFKNWLAGLTPTTDRDQAILDWKNELRKLATDAAKSVMATGSSRDATGYFDQDQQVWVNIFIVMSWFQGKIKRDLGLKKGEIKEDGR